MHEVFYSSYTRKIMFVSWDYNPRTISLLLLIFNKLCYSLHLYQPFSIFLWVIIPTEIVVLTILQHEVESYQDLLMILVMEPS